jgi:hypothetical protein
MLRDCEDECKADVKASGTEQHRKCVATADNKRSPHQLTSSMNSLKICGQSQSGDIRTNLAEGALQHGAEQAAMEHGAEQASMPSQPVKTDGLDEKVSHCSLNAGVGAGAQGPTASHKMHPLRDLENFSRIDVWRKLRNQRVRVADSPSSPQKQEAEIDGKELATSQRRPPSKTNDGERGSGSGSGDKSDKTSRAAAVRADTEGSALGDIRGIEAPVSDALLRVLPRVLSRNELSRILVLFHGDSAQEAARRCTLWDLVREKGYQDCDCLAG